MSHLSPRLAAVAAFVREGAVLADIGTDHAQLPVSLVSEGKIRLAVASDINEGPVLRAGECVGRHQFDEKIKVVLADGLHGLDSYNPTDIVIAGMGGELIRDILSASQFPKKSGVRLILQPMTMQHELRKYLTENKFYIRGETLSLDGRIYNILCAEYDEKQAEEPYSELELYIGRRLIESKPEHFDAYMMRHLEILDMRIAGMNRAKLDTNSLKKLRCEMAALISSHF